VQQCNYSSSQQEVNENISFLAACKPFLLFYSDYCATDLQQSRVLWFNTVHNLMSAPLTVYITRSFHEISRYVSLHQHCNGILGKKNVERLNLGSPILEHKMITKRRGLWLILGPKVQSTRSKLKVTGLETKVSEYLTMPMESPHFIDIRQMTRLYADHVSCFY